MSDLQSLARSLKQLGDATTAVAEQLLEILVAQDLEHDFADDEALRVANAR